MWRNDTKYMFMSSLKKIARKGLNRRVHFLMQVHIQTIAVQNEQVKWFINSYLNISIYICLGVYVSIVVLKQQTSIHFWPMSRDCKKGWKKSTDIYSKHLCFISWILLRWPNVMGMTSSRKGTRGVCSCTAQVISLRYNNTIISSVIFYDCNTLSRELTLYIEFIYWENGVCVCLGGGGGGGGGGLRHRIRHA